MLFAANSMVSTDILLLPKRFIIGWREFVMLYRLIYRNGFDWRFHIIVEQN